MPSSDTQFKRGKPGRPKGSRNKLSEDFLKALADDFEKHGVDTIVAARESDPVAYVRMIAGLLPKEINAEITQRYVVEVPMPIGSIEDWAKLNGDGKTIKH